MTPHIEAQLPLASHQSSCPSFEPSPNLKISLPTAPDKLAMQRSKIWGSAARKDHTFDVYAGGDLVSRLCFGISNGCSCADLSIFYGFSPVREHGIWKAAYWAVRAGRKLPALPGRREDGLQCRVGGRPRQASGLREIINSFAECLHSYCAADDTAFCSDGS